VRDARRASVDTDILRCRPGFDPGPRGVWPGRASDSGPRIAPAGRPGRQGKDARIESGGVRANFKILPIFLLFSLTSRFLSPISVSVNARTAPAAVSGRPRISRMSIPLPPRSGGTRRRLPCPAGRVSQPGSRFPFGMPGL